MKIKKKTDKDKKVYDFFQHAEDDCIEYVISDSDKSYSLKSRNFGMMLSFAKRLKDSGHTIICSDELVPFIPCGSMRYESDNADCEGCILNTGAECLLARSEGDGSEVDISAGDGSDDLLEDESEVS